MFHKEFDFFSFLHKQNIIYKVSCLSSYALLDNALAEKVGTRSGGIAEKGEGRGEAPVPRAFIEHLLRAGSVWGVD